jgi:hypothetical protein
MPTAFVRQGNPTAVFRLPKPGGINGLARSESLRSAMEKIDRIISASRLHFPTAAENLLHWRDGGGRDRILPASLFQSERQRLDHLSDNHRPRLMSVTKRRLISGALTPGQSDAEMERTDTIKPHGFTNFLFALGEFTIHSRAQTVVERTNGQLVVRLNQWRVEITDEYDWDPDRWALTAGIGRVTVRRHSPCKKVATADATLSGPTGRRSPTPKSLGRRRSRREIIEAVTLPREKSYCRRRPLAADTSATRSGVAALPPALSPGKNAGRPGRE